ncbi:MAG: hypothetical protein U9Q81_19330 [Pseudomonadota bacterium]|nr:hypothetical protein [Pseudomonadota bacterium]
MANKKTCSWTDFLGEFGSALDRWEERIETFKKSKESDGRPPPLIYRPAWDASPDPRHLCIGVGDWSRYPWKAPQEGQKVGILLNNKGAPSPGSARYASICDMVTDLDFAAWPVWSRATADLGTPSELLGRFTLVVEDVSPDSCLGLILFFARSCGVPRDELPAPWIDYARRWEEGDVKTTGAPFESWGALHSALAHSFAPPTDEGSSVPSGGIQDREADLCLTRAWLSCLRFDAAALASSALPNCMSAMDLIVEDQLARGFLNYEQQNYLSSLGEATCLQLLVPMEGIGHRQLMVDTMLLEEEIPDGTKKVFARNDREHTWLHDGFALMALNRPHEIYQGSGNDIVVSADTTFKIELSDLWRALEAREDALWAGERPCDKPRRDMVRGYPQGKRPDGSNAPNQPWFLFPDLSLVAAPKHIFEPSDGASGVLGSRLDWPEVREILWQTYQPMRFLEFDDLNAPEPLSPVRLEVCRPQLFGKEGHSRRRALYRLAWRQTVVCSQAARLSPTAKRCYAALAARGGDFQGGSRPIALVELPQPASFDFLSFEGGFAVVHRNGTVLVDDWRTSKLPDQELCREFELCTRRLAAIAALEVSIGKLIEEQTREMTESVHQLDHLAILDVLTRFKIEIASELTATALQTNDPEVIEFRAVIERRWGMAERLQEAYRNIDRVEGSIRAYSELYTNRRVNQLTVYGFPLVLATGLLALLLPAPDEEHSSYLAEVHWIFERFHWHSFFYFCLFTVVGILLLRYWPRRSAARARWPFVKKLREWLNRSRH